MTEHSHVNGGSLMNGSQARAVYGGKFAIYAGNGDASAVACDGPTLDSSLRSMTTGRGAYVGQAEGYLFNPNFLRDIPWGEESQSKFKDNISAHNPGADLYLRPLHIDDYKKGFLDILAMLTKVGTVSEEEFRLQFDLMRKCPNTYFVTVLEDKKSGKVIGCATLLLEYKFIHSAGVRGRIEDVVVSDEYRGRQLGKLLLETLTILGRETFGCYKMSLECKDSLIKFYGQFGYKKDEGNNYMQQRFSD